jgi:hypothetical protein
MNIETKKDMELYSKHPLIRFSISTNKFKLSDIIQYMNKIYELNMSGNKNIRYTCLFEGVTKLNLSGTCITDASALGKVYDLDLSYTALTNVSALGGVHTLNLSWTKTEDVSALGGVHTLNLSCTKVTDVSPLINVHTLNISWCNISNTSVLKNVTVLYNKTNKRFWSI